MANAAILIEWGMPRDGRENKALEVFFSTMQNWEQWKAAGRIESFHTFGTLSGNMEQRAGFIVVMGTEQQIAALHKADDYRQQLVKVITIGVNVTITNCETGDAMATRMQRYATTLKSMGL